MSELTVTKLDGYYMHPLRGRAYDMKDMWVKPPGNGVGYDADPDIFGQGGRREVPKDQRGGRGRDRDDEVIGAKRKALDDHLSRVINDPLELSRAQELINGLCGAYTEGENGESGASAEDRRRMGLDSGRAGDGVLSEFFAKHPAPPHV